MKAEDFELHTTIVRGLQMILDGYKNWLKRKKEKAT